MRIYAKAFKKLFVFGGMGLCIAATQGCKRSFDDYFRAPPASNSASLHDHDPPPSGCPLNTQHFSQPPASTTSSVDLLIVSDSSSSLNDERGRIADNLQSFVAAIPSTIDLRVAVMLAHGSTSTYTGRLYTSGGKPRVLNPATSSLTQVSADLRYVMTHTTEDADSDGGELGMYSFNRSLDADRVTEIRGQGFYRTDAALAVIFVSDENDICAVYPAGVTPVPDPQGGEARAKARDCGGITASGVFQRARALQSGRPLSLNAIIYTNPATVPPGGENEVGYGYLDIVAAANGISVDLAAASFAAGLGQIGALVNTRLNLTVDVELPANVDPRSIVVKVDGVSATFTYSAATRILHLLQPGRAGSAVEIGYCYATP